MSDFPKLLQLQLSTSGFVTILEPCNYLFAKARTERVELTEQLFILSIGRHDAMNLGF
jgi:hypothetical protein